jgi:hypothetical protein
VLGERYAKLAGAEAWAAFLFASYLLGHLVFLLGSWLDGIYDWLHVRHGSVKVAVYTECPSMPAAGICLPTRINAAMCAGS